MLRRVKLIKVNTNTDMATIAGDTNTIYGQERTSVPITHPYSGRGWGVRVGIETDTSAIVGYDENNKPYVIGYYTQEQYLKDSPNSSRTENEVKYKTLKEGEIVLQSQSNSSIFLNQSGDITASTSDGTLLEINKQTDSINLLSVNQTIITEAVNIKNGLVRRDLRSNNEKVEDLFLNSLLIQDFSIQQDLDIVGADPQYSISDQYTPLVGTFDPTTGTPSILSIDGIKNTPNADKIVQNIKNPALTEYRIDVNEFADGTTSLSLSDETQEIKKGRLPQNLAGSLVLGTVVNDNGTIARFDYLFGTGDPKGHGEIWKLPGLNENHDSVDFKIDLSKTIRDPSALNNKLQWTVNSIKNFNTGQMFQLILNTRGGDNNGEVPNKTNIGSKWQFQVDKQGLTKWNIPASTALGEPFRSGRSLLWNSDGSITQSVGFENNQELPNITGQQDDAKFVNLTDGRVKKSWIADFAGGIDHRIGTDSAGQSQTIEADGALSFYYGVLNPQIGSAAQSIVSNISTIGVEAPSQSRTRLGNSISGRTAGSIELDVGATPNSKQSIGLHTKGIVKIALGKDDANDSLVLNTAGSVRIKNNSGHRFELLSTGAGEFQDGILLQHGGITRSVIQIDSNGVITIRNSLANSNIIMSANGDISAINLSGKISLSATGDISIGGATAGIDISPTSGVILRTSGGSISLNTLGKVEVAANSGFAVTGPFAHLNTTATALTPSAAVSPFVVASIGPNSLDPFSGNVCSISGFPTVKG